MNETAPATVEVSSIPFAVRTYQQSDQPVFGPRFGSNQADESDLTLLKQATFRPVEHSSFEKSEEKSALLVQGIPDYTKGVLRNSPYQRAADVTLWPVGTDSIHYFHTVSVVHRGETIFATRRGQKNELWRYNPTSNTVIPITIPGSLTTFHTNDVSGLAFDNDVCYVSVRGTGGLWYFNNVGYTLSFVTGSTSNYYQVFNLNGKMYDMNADGNIHLWTGSTSAQGHTFVCKVKDYEYNTPDKPGHKFLGVLNGIAYILFSGGIFAFDGVRGYQVMPTVPVSFGLPRINRVSNPSFEDAGVGTSNWTIGVSGTGQSLARVTTEFYSGAASMRINSGTANNGAAMLGANLAVGQTYTVSAYMKGTAGQQLYVNINGVAGTATTFDVATGAWQRVSRTFVCTSGSGNISFGQNQASSTCYIDAVMLEQSATVNDYFDGSSTDTDQIDYYWTGTSGNSFSSARPIAGGSINMLSSYNGYLYFNRANTLWRFNGGTIEKLYDFSEWIIPVSAAIAEDGLYIHMRDDSIVTVDSFHQQLLDDTVVPTGRKEFIYRYDGVNLVLVDWVATDIVSTPQKSANYLMPSSAGVLFGTITPSLTGSNNTRTLRLYSNLRNSVATRANRPVRFLTNNIDMQLPNLDKRVMNATVRFANTPELSGTDNMRIWWRSDIKNSWTLIGTHDLANPVTDYVFDFGNGIVSKEFFFRVDIGNGELGYTEIEFESVSFGYIVASPLRRQWNLTLVNAPMNSMEEPSAEETPFADLFPVVRDGQHVVTFKDIDGTEYDVILDSYVINNDMVYPDADNEYHSVRYTVVLREV